MKVEMLKRLTKKIVFTTGEQRGVTLLETLIALALLGIFGVVFLAAISTSSITMANVEKKVTIENLARAQMEYIKSCPYINYIYGPPDTPPDYQTLDELDPTDPYAIAIPTGYSINVTAVALHQPDGGIQKVTTTILREGESLLVVEGYKVNR